MIENRIRILVVDDSALYRLLIQDVLKKISACTIVGFAENGTDALDKIEQLDPDLVTLDIEMPGMNGIDVLREMNRRKIRAKAVMVSRFSDAGAQLTTEALFEGAFDFILKPTGSNPSTNKDCLRRELESKIEAFGQRRRNRPMADLAVRTEKSIDTKDSIQPWRSSVVVIGCSTGGPDALRQMLPNLPVDFPVPVLVVQHMPSSFTRPLADRLHRMSALDVLEAENGMQVEAGKVFIACGGHQLKLIKHDNHVSLEVTDDPPENNCRPAVDYTLRSTIDVFGGSALGVILTGMGRDGLEGCRALKARGGRVIAQDADGCDVYGMPKAIIDASLADRIVKLKNISNVVIREVQGAR